MNSLYLAHKDFINELRAELRNPQQLGDRLFLAPHFDAVVWAQDVWRDVVKIEFASISQAVKALKAMNRRWFCFSHVFHRRARLIADELRAKDVPRIEFGSAHEKKPFGCFTLTDQNTIYASVKPREFFPFGVYEFVEDKNIPPNRAYLKLWEALTRFNIKPGVGDVCLDLGSSPGGWTWVLAELGATVISVDKAKLDAKIAKMPNVNFVEQSAFALDPKDFPDAKFIFCDVACYPERLYELVSRWLSASNVKNFVCTIKLQGKTDFAAIQKFQAIQGSRVVHLYHNKHEVTWVR